MRVVVRGPEGDRVVAVTGVRPGHTVGDLAVVLGGAGTVWVNGRRLAPDTPLRVAGIVDGDLVASTEPAGASRDGIGTGRALVVIAGHGASGRLGLSPGVHILGRSPGADLRLTAPSVSAEHARVTVGRDGGVVLTDLGSRNGTLVDGTAVAAGAAARVRAGAVVQVGAVALRLTPGTESEPAALEPRGDSARILHRPPPTPTPAVPAVSLPPPPDETTRHRPESRWAMLLAPVAASAVLAVVWDPRLALLGLLTPVMLLGTWLEDGWRAGRSARTDAAARRRRRAIVAGRLEAARTAARERLEHTAPDLAARTGWALARSGRLWERRGAAALRVVVGLGSARMPFEVTGAPTSTDTSLLTAAGTGQRLPMEADLGDGPLGIVGPASATRGVLRAILLSAVTGAGPADVTVAVAGDAPTGQAPTGWAWTGWLPHHSADAAAAGGGGPRLVVVDGAAAARRPDVREHVATGGAAVVGVRERAALPSACTTILTVDAHGVTTMTGPGGPRRLLAPIVDVDRAGTIARRLAPLRDPDTTGSGALPAVARLPPLLGLPDEVTADAIHDRWRRADGGLPVTLGVGSDGAVEIDLARHGPHALIGGMTGAGKSELLRTVVASAAATVGPDRLNLLLIDYKGGSAFDACGDLPHVAGLVTDLDEHLGERALVCLEAELRHRERRLRAAGVSDIAALDAAEVLPRLVVMVDEVAALVADLPDFVSSLVDVAQRGRSLGVHLILATQRPAGAITADIRANTDVAVALRVQDTADSTDIVGVPDAAALPRERPGLALLRHGAGAPIRVQTAWTGARPPPGELEVRPLWPQPASGDAGAATGTRTPTAPADPTDLRRLVTACRRAAADLPPARCPWPPPLPGTVEAAALPPGDVGAATVPLGVADEPWRQRQCTAELDLRRGTVVLLGRRRSGPGSTLVALALRLAAREAPDACHLYAIDHDAGRLAPLAGLPHVGAVVPAADRARQRRLVAMLAGEIADRRGRGRTPEDGTAPRVVLLVAGAAAFLRAFDDPDGMSVPIQLEEVAREGAAVGVHVAVTAERPGDLPSGLLATAGTRLAFTLTDPYDHAVLGLATAPPGGRPGRAVEAPDGRELQLATVVDVADVVTTIAADHEQDRADPRTGGPAPVRLLPATVTLDELGTPFPRRDTGWRATFAMGDDTLAPVALDLTPGDHVLVAGPAGSGRTTTLRTLAALGADAGIDVYVSAPADGALTAAVTATPVAPGDLDAVVGEAAGSRLLLVDDGEAVRDGGPLRRLLDREDRDLHVVIGGRSDLLRAAPPPWLRRVTGGGLGVVLQPDVETDGALWGTVLPRQRRELAWPPGRGLLLCRGTSTVVQVATP